MALNQQGLIVLLGIIVLAVVIGLLAFLDSLTNIISELLRVFGLYGFLLLSFAAIMTPFMREIRQAFGKSFIDVHHGFAVLGLVLITLHPIASMAESGLTVFVPRFDSWLTFWTLAGRPAFYVIYLAVAAAVLRRKIPKSWRPFHVLLYLALFFGVVHANLIGSDFQSLPIIVIFDLLFAAVIASFAIKRYRNYSMRRKLIEAKKFKAPKMTPSNSHFYELTNW